MDEQLQHHADPENNDGNKQIIGVKQTSVQKQNQKTDIENSMARAGTVGREEKGEAIY